MSSGEPEGKRSYDAQSRRERAEQERRDTRERVTDAARRLFLANGYAATKMVDIAEDAGVAIASVYRAGRSKAELIEMILELDTVGDEPLSKRPTYAALERPEFPLIAAEPDPQQQVLMIADRIAGVLDRLAPLWTVLRDAASVDPRAAATMHAMLEHRGTSFEVAVGMLPEHRLRESRSQAVDTLWALSSPETYLMLCSVRGWSHRHYRDWLRRTLLVQLLAPTVDSSEKNHPPAAQDNADNQPRPPHC
jgi:AcrR family transcriptional regulator